MSSCRFSDHVLGINVWYLYIKAFLHALGGRVKYRRSRVNHQFAITLRLSAHVESFQALVCNLTSTDVESSTSISLTHLYIQDKILLMHTTMCNLFPVFIITFKNVQTLNTFTGRQVPTTSPILIYAWQDSTQVPP